MIRTVIWLLLSILLITFLRFVIGIIGKAVGDLFGPSGAGRPVDTATSRKAQSAGELRRDPICGTYVDAATSVKKELAGETLHFCSVACREKHDRVASS